MHLLKPDWSNKLALLKRLMDALKGNSLPPGDAGFGGVRSDEAVDLPPGDAGFGGVRSDEAVDLPPGDAGFGGVRPDEAVDLPPGDAGFGGVRPDEAAGPNSLANSGDSIPAFERTVTTL
jgi:hypothetical protein